MNEKYEPIKFDSWQELAKYVIDGGEVYFKALDHKYIKVWFSGVGFNCDIDKVFVNRDTYIKKQQTLEELIAIKPRLLWIWKELECKKEIKLVDKYNYKYIVATHCFEMLTDDEIKQFLSGE